MRIFVFTLSALLMMLPLPVSAQDAAQDYRLVQPDLTTYLEAIPLAMALDQSEGQWNAQAILVEVHKRYGSALSDADHPTLRAAFNSTYGSYLGAGYGYLPYQHEWEHAMLLAWLRDNQIDLAKTNSLHFDDYDMVITPHDFDGDGISEYILDVIRNCLPSSQCRSSPYDRGAADYAEYLVIQGDTPDRYHTIDNPLPWLSRQYHYSMPQESTLYPLESRDLTGDSRDEWLWIGRGYGGRNASRVSLYILTWRDGSLINLAPDDHTMSYLDYTGNCLALDCLNVWRFNDMPGQPAVIDQTVSTEDNWECIAQERVSFTLSGTAFEAGEPIKSYPATFECVIRQAERAMIAGDWKAAIPRYERALAMQDQADYAAYTRIRLALAYALIGRLDDAHRELENVQALSQESEERIPDRSDYNTIPELVTALLDAYGSDPTGNNLCLAAYQFMTTQPEYLLNHLSLFAGDVTANLGYASYRQPLTVSNVTEMGCDIAPIFEDSVHHLRLSVDVSPDDALAEAGWPVRGTFHTDLNADSIDDWLVWIDAQMIPPALFVSSANRYAASLWGYPDGHENETLYPPDENYAIEPLTLPDGSIAVATLDYILTPPLMARLSDIGGGPQCEPPARQGNLSLWRLEEENLIRFFFTQVCEEGEIADFVTPERILGTVVVVRPDTYYLLAPVTYTWDANSHTFTAPPQPTFVPPPTSINEPPRYPESHIASAISDFQSGEYERGLSTMDNLLRFADALPIEIRLAAYYVRAMILEQLHRSDEALADYIAVFEIAPESGWGRLAALHLEAANA